MLWMYLGWKFTIKQIIVVFLNKTLIYGKNAV